jgi:microcystin-dependent protein
MSNPFLGELRLAGFSFAPYGWAMANGQVLAIAQNTALFSLLGTNFGGNGTSNFALPNLQGSTPVGAGQGPGLSLYDVGESGGASTVVLLQSEIPAHSHTVQADGTPANQQSPANDAFAKASSTAGNLYTTNTTTKVQMNQNLVTPYGNNVPHNNLMPYLTLNWIIALQGVFPTRG